MMMMLEVVMAQLSLVCFCSCCFRSLPFVEPRQLLANHLKQARVDAGPVKNSRRAQKQLRGDEVLEKKKMKIVNFVLRITN
jgi:hypothetical protein